MFQRARASPPWNCGSWYRPVYVKGLQVAGDERGPHLPSLLRRSWKRKQTFPLPPFPFLALWGRRNSNRVLSRLQMA